MKKRVVIIFILLLLLVCCVMFLIKRAEQDRKDDVQDNFENTVLETEDHEEHELPQITSMEQKDKGIEEVGTHENGDGVAVNDSRNNSSDVSTDEEKSTSIENIGESSEQTKAEDENTDIVDSDKKTKIELPFVPAN